MNIIHTSQTTDYYKLKHEIKVLMLRDRHITMTTIAKKLRISIKLVNELKSSIVL